tara:strand:- start:1757 stop:1972 length:216 start_codon:yes stop_codon:yes gene_type:complete
MKKEEVMSNFALDLINDQIMEMDKAMLLDELSSGLISRIKLMFLSTYQLRVLMREQLLQNDYYDEEVNDES